MMKNPSTTSPLLLPLLLLIGIVSFSSTAHGQSKRNAGLIKERRFQRLMQKKQAVLLDVRTPEEHKEGHIPGARLLNIQGPGFTDSLQTLDRNKTYLLYCRSAKRSQKAVNLMKERGFKNVYHLKGGFTQWNGSKE